MTDDELERALRALPLEEPPAELRGRVLAAVAAPPQPALRPWELPVLGTVVALAVWLCLVAPTLGALARATGLISLSTLLWCAIGLSSAWWISHLTLMPTPRVAVTKR